jgi:hypothetical protein
MQGTREWTDYEASAEVTPHMALSCGIAARCQGMRRYVALSLTRDERGAPIVELGERRGDEGARQRRPFPWEPGRSYELRLELRGDGARAWVDGEPLLSLGAISATLDGGGVALLCEEGRASFERVAVRPVAGLA